MVKFIDILKDHTFYLRKIAHLLHMTQFLKTIRTYIHSKLSMKIEQDMIQSPMICTFLQHLNLIRIFKFLYFQTKILIQIHFIVRKCFSINEESLIAWTQFQHKEVNYLQTRVTVNLTTILLSINSLDMYRKVILKHYNSTLSLYEFWQLKKIKNQKIPQN